MKSLWFLFHIVGSILISAQYKVIKSSGNSGKILKRFEDEKCSYQWVFSEFNPSTVTHPNLLEIATFKKQYKISFTLVIHSTSSSTGSWQSIFEIRGAVHRHPTFYLYLPTMVSKERI